MGTAIRFSFVEVPYLQSVWAAEPRWMYTFFARAACSAEAIISHSTYNGPHATLSRLPPVLAPRQRLGGR